MNKNACNKILIENMHVLLLVKLSVRAVRVRVRPYRLVLGVAGTPQQQRDQLRSQDQAVEGERSEALLQGPLLAGGLVGVQVGVGHVPVDEVRGRRGELQTTFTLKPASEAVLSHGGDSGRVI